MLVAATVMLKRVFVLRRCVLWWWFENVGEVEMCAFDEVCVYTCFFFYRMSW